VIQQLFNSPFNSTLYPQPFLPFLGPSQTCTVFCTRAQCGVPLCPTLKEHPPLFQEKGGRLVALKLYSKGRQ